MSIPARRLAAFCVWAWFAATAHGAGPPAARQVILMIADGAGYNTWAATAMYEGSTGREFHDGPGWVRLAASTHPLRASPEPGVSAAMGDVQFPHLVYDAARAWDTTPDAGLAGRYPYLFAGYRWLRETASDSANTVTTLVAGTKTYPGAINVDGAGRPVRDTLAQLAHDAGKRVGVVSSVPFTHATPAGAAGAHHADRRHLCSIAVEMLTSPLLDLIAGAGHPGFDNNGLPLEDPGSRIYDYVGGKPLWEALDGTAALTAGGAACTDPDGVARSVTDSQIAALAGWSLVDAGKRIEALARGPVADKLLVVPRVGQRRLWTGQPAVDGRPAGAAVGGTLQQQRGSAADPRYTAPGDDPPLAGIPSLETLTRVALNALDDGEGFFLHVEGGAVDWAMHETQMGRMIEEMLDFKRAVAAVVAWVDGRDAWDETLLIVTSDHDHLFWGPAADRVPFDPLRDNGAGRLPAYRWLHDSHSNALVPVYARGAGVGRLSAAARGVDPFRGPYIDQADVYRVLSEALKPSAAP